MASFPEGGVDRAIRYGDTPEQAITRAVWALVNDKAVDDG